MKLEYQQMVASITYIKALESEEGHFLVYFCVTFVCALLVLLYVDTSSTFTQKYLSNYCSLLSVKFY